MSYNGWTNYETWAASLWLDNDEGSQDFIRNAALDYLALYDGNRSAAVAGLASEIDYLIEEGQPDIGASLYQDLLETALSNVDVMEIAEAAIDDNYEDWEEEQDEEDA